MVRAFWFVALAVSFASACSRTADGCPKNMVREGGHCVWEDPSVPGELMPVDADGDSSTSASARRASRDGGEHEVSPGMSDAGTGAPVPGDAARDLDASALADADTGADTRDPMREGGLIPIDAYAGDVGLDAVVGAADAAADAEATDASSPLDALVSVDGSPDASDVSEAGETPADASNADAADAESDGGDAALPPMCSDGDLSNWRTFEVSGQLVQTIATCFARDPRCATGACDLALCLRQSAGVAGCVECVAAETNCALAACASSCGSSDTSDACRACACAQGCIGGTTACGMGAVNVCADCRGGTCNNVSLDPALIMVIVDTVW